MNTLALVAVSLFIAVLLLAPAVLFFDIVVPQHVTKAKRYAVTLKNNEGSFLALCVEKRRDRWTFEDVRLTPSNPGGPVLAAAPGRLYVPCRNILYYQEIQETANVAE